MAEIYIQKLNDQSPHNEDEVIAAVKSGKFAPNDLACLRGMSEWKPLYEILELPDEVLTNFDARAEKEFKLLSIYEQKTAESLKMWCSNGENIQLQRDFQNKLEMFQKQTMAFKAQFPDFVEAKISESMLYCYHAFLKAGNVGYFRQASGRSETLVGGVVTGMIAKGQEKRNVLEALKLVDYAIQIADTAYARNLKAALLVDSGRKVEAIQELNYIITNFADDEEIYFEARQLKDELETPPKKSGCFIATAVYGSALAPEVVFFSRYRDEVLRKSKLGRLFIRFYYFTSPPFASLIGNANFLKKLTRKLLLSPLLKWLKSKV